MDCALGRLRNCHAALPGTQIKISVDAEPSLGLCFLQLPTKTGRSQSTLPGRPFGSKQHKAEPKHARSSTRGTQDLKKQFLKMCAVADQSSVYCVSLRTGKFLLAQS